MLLYHSTKQYIITHICSHPDCLNVKNGAMKASMLLTLWQASDIFVTFNTAHERSDNIVV